MIGQPLPVSGKNLEILCHLDGNSNDSSGNGRNGSDTSMSYTNRKYKQAALFGGSGRINFGDILDKTYNQAFTIKMWFRSTGSDEDGACLLSKITGWGAHTGYWIHRWSDNKIHFTLSWTYSSGGYMEVYTNADFFADSKWHFLVCTYDGSGSRSGMKIYVDGCPVPITTAGNSSTTQNLTNSAGLQLGDASVDGNRNFKGDIEEFEFYSREVPAAEIRKWFTWAKGKFL